MACHGSGLLQRQDEELALRLQFEDDGHWGCCAAALQGELWTAVGQSLVDMLSKV